MTRALSVIFLIAISACSDARHPLDEQLSQLKPTAVVALQGLGWPAGTLLCPLTPYQSRLPGDSSTAWRVNAYLEKKQFEGDEGHWSMVIVKPTPTGDAGIEQLVFKRGKYDVVNSPARRSTESAAFKPRECVEVKEVHVLVTSSGASQRTLISFGTEK